MQGLPLVLFANFWMALTLLWTQMGVWPVLGCTLLLLQLAVLRYARAPAPWDWFAWPEYDAHALLMGALLCLPVGLYWALTLQQDFPLSGDHLHHVLTEQELYAAFFPWGTSALVLASLLAWLKRPQLVLALLALVWAVLLLSFDTTQALGPVLRFPAGAYSLALPLFPLFSATEIQTLDLLRALNVLSLPLYLFVLRPRLLGRAPDLRVALLVAPWLFQKDWIYFFTTDYLEPWALVFVWLALESFITAELPLWRAFLLSLVACAFKELAIFIFAPIALCLGFRALRARDWRTLLGCAGVSAPLVCYLLLRKAHTWRNVKIAPLSELNWPANLAQVLAHWQVHLRWGGVLALVLLLSLTALALVKRSSLRWRLLALLGFALAAELVFLTDSVSLDWLGLPRFHLLTWPVLSVGLLVLTRLEWSANLLPWALGAVVLLQATALPAFYAQALQSDAARNGIEHYRAPIFLPARELAAHLLPGTPLRVNVLHHGMMMPYRPLSLHDWRQTQLTALRFGSQPLCACDERSPQVMNLEAYLPPEQQGLDRNWSSARELDDCLARARQTCARIHEAHAPDGALLGFLGQLR